MTIFLAILLGLFFIALHILIGGPHLAFALPAYSLLGIAALFSLAQFRRQRSGADPLCLASAVLLSGYIQLRAIGAPYPFFADRELLLAQACLVVYLLFALVITGPRDRLIVLGLLGLLTLGHTAVGLYQFVEDHNFTFWHIGRFAYGWRASGFLICPNHTASFMTVVMLLAGGLLTFGRFGATRKVALCGFLLFSAVGLAITGSRGGMLGLAVGAIALFILSLPVWRNYYMWRWWKTLMAPVIVTVALAASFHFATRLPIVEPIVGRFHNIPDDMQWRLTAWKMGLQQFQTAPVFGTGAGTYIIYGRAYRPESLQIDVVHAHNEYVELLAEYGLVGLVLLLLCLGLHVRRWWISYRYLAFQRLPSSGGGGSNALGLNLGALCAILAVMAAACFDFNMQIPGVAAAAAFAFAILASPGPVERRARSSSSKGASETPLVPLTEPEREPDWLKPAAEPRWVTTFCRVIPAVLGLVLIAWTARYAYPEALLYRARMLLVDDGDFEAGIALLEKSVEWNPRNHQAYFYLGEARRLEALKVQDQAERERQLKVAADDFRHALKLFPDNDRTLWGLAKIYDYFGQREDSELLWKRLLRLDPNQARVRLHYGKHLYVIGDFAGALREFKHCQRLQASVPDTHRLIALAQRRVDEERAKTSATEIPAPAPTSPAPTPEAQRQDDFGINPDEG